MDQKVTSIGMFLKGAVALKKGSSRYLKTRHPWVFSNELVKIDTKIPPGSWVSLEDSSGHTLGYGHFNPHSLIAFRVFERAPFVSEAQTRALFFKRLDAAWQLRQRAYGEAFRERDIGTRSFRLCFGESDGLSGFILDLFEGGTSGVASMQCHSAGADQFIFWAQQWLEERMAISAGVVRNDLEVRRRENVALETSEWGNLPSSPFALEGGVKFFVDLRKGQKTGYFYDHRDNRARFAELCSGLEGSALDCFSYVGSWGLQILKKNPKLQLSAVDVSRAALDQLLHNAMENGLGDRVEAIEMDFFKDKDGLGSKKFAAVVSDPPSLTSSAKQAAQGRRAHKACFSRAVAHLAKEGLAAFASCSFHLTWDEFMGCVADAAAEHRALFRLIQVGSQAADHPILSSLPETRYLKCVIGWRDMFV